MQSPKIPFQYPVLTLLALLGACGTSGSAPVLQSVSDQVVAVNTEIVVLLSASDEDGDEVFYSFQSAVPEIDKRASLNRLPIGVGEFRWTPKASDVGEWYFDFTASDGNYSDTITIRIDVKSALGSDASPRFIHPQGNGTTLDIEKSKCLDIKIEIADSDSTDVEITQAEPIIPGSTLKQSEPGLKATWQFCPTNEQKASGDRYTLLLRAYDGENPSVVYPYVIVLRTPLQSDCKGEAPVVQHTPADITSLRGIVIEAKITDDIGLKQQPLLYYSADNIQLSMVPTNKEDVWTTTIPNPVVDKAVGASAELSYFIVADDNDDTAGSCDHRTQAPADMGSYTLKVTNPGGPGGGLMCESCSSDIQCGDADTDLCVVVGGPSFCLQDCSAGCPQGYECSSNTLTSVNGAVGKQCVPVSLDCSNPAGETCVDDAFENNDYLVEADNHPPLTSATDYNLASCPSSTFVDDEDWFRIEVPQAGDVVVRLVGKNGNSDLDLGLWSTEGKIASSILSNSVEDINTCVDAGSYYLRVYANYQIPSDYTLSYTTTPRECGDFVCLPDVLENDDDAGNATEVNLAVIYQRQDLSLCSDNEDWYKVEFSTGELLAVDLTFEQSDGDLDIHLYDENLTPLSPPCTLVDPICDIGNGQTSTSNESAIFEAPAGCAPCTRYVVVRGWGQSEAPYGIRMERDDGL